MLRLTFIAKYSDGIKRLELRQALWPLCIPSCDSCETSANHGREFNRSKLSPRTGSFRKNCSYLHWTKLLLWSFHGAHSRTAVHHGLTGKPWQLTGGRTWYSTVRVTPHIAKKTSLNWHEVQKKTKNIKKPEQQTQIGKVVKSQALTSWCSPPVVQSIACLGPVQGCCKWSQLPWRFVSKEFKNIQNMMQDVNRSAWRLSWSCSKWLIGLTLAWPIRKKNSTQSVSPPFLIQLIFQMTVFSALKSQILDANAVSPEDPMAGTRA
jgi:hypothetical protein